MRTILRFISLASFALAGVIALALILSPPAEPLFAILAAVLFFGLGIVFRAWRATIT
jgi:hypothetical protein